MDQAEAAPGPKVSDKIIDRYTLVEKLGSGAFGEIYKALDLHTREHYAVKFENSDVGKILLLAKEAVLMQKMEGGRGFPKLYNYFDDKNQKVLVMTLLGPDLVEMYKMCRCKFSMKTILLIAEQMISLLERLHESGHIHRDVKPENFTVPLNWMRPRNSRSGQNNNANEDIGTIHLIDFGLSKSFLREDGRHIEFDDNRGVVGTGRYMSLNANQGFEQSRRDDMESLGYVLLLLLRNLPWQNLRTDEKSSKYKKILEMKQTMPLTKLCEGIPIEFYEYIKYCRKLGFEETPNYNHLRKMFRSLFNKLEYQDDMKYDWYYLNMNYSSVKREMSKHQENVEDDVADTSIKRHEIRRLDTRLSKRKMENPNSPGKISHFSLQLPTRGLTIPLQVSIKSLEPNMSQSVNKMSKDHNREISPGKLNSESSSKNVYLPRSFISNTSYANDNNGKGKNHPITMLTTKGTNKEKEQQKNDQMQHDQQTQDYTGNELPVWTKMKHLEITKIMPRQSIFSVMSSKMD